MTDSGHEKPENPGGTEPPARLAREHGTGPKPRGPIPPDESQERPAAQSPPPRTGPTNDRGARGNTHRPAETLATYSRRRVSTRPGLPMPQAAKGGERQHHGRRQRRSEGRKLSAPHHPSRESPHGEQACERTPSVEPRGRGSQPARSLPTVGISLMNDQSAPTAPRGSTDGLLRKPAHHEALSLRPPALEVASSRNSPQRPQTKQWTFTNSCDTLVMLNLSLSASCVSGGLFEAAS